MGEKGGGWWCRIGDLKGGSLAVLYVQYFTLVLNVLFLWEIEI